MNAEELRKIDASNMFEVIKDFPGQVEAAVEIGKNAPTFRAGTPESKVVVLGMGGSAIGGDLLRTYAASLPGANKLMISVNRTYDLPGYVDADTLVVASSYSGNTEETLSGFEQASGKTKNIIAITTGGSLEENARKGGFDVVNVPAGFQPRCALGFSFFPMIELLMRSGAFTDEARSATEKAIDETISLLKERSVEYSKLDGNNKAIRIAREIKGCIPVIYSPSDRLDTVNLRWRCQIQENAKYLAFGNLLPEMNHNEINSWTNPAELVKKFKLLIMSDRDDHKKVTVRLKAVADLTGENTAGVIRLEGSGESLLTRMFDLIYLGDWVSYYLAIESNCDPTPIPLIIRLKELLKYS